MYDFFGNSFIQNDMYPNEDNLVRAANYRMLDEKGLQYSHVHYIEWDSNETFPRGIALGDKSVVWMDYDGNVLGLPNSHPVAKEHVVPGDELDAWLMAAQSATRVGRYLQLSVPSYGPDGVIVNGKNPSALIFTDHKELRDTSGILRRPPVDVMPSLRSHLIGTRTPAMHG